MYYLQGKHILISLFSKILIKEVVLVTLFITQVRRPDLGGGSLDQVILSKDCLMGIKKPALRVRSTSRGQNSVFKNKSSFKTLTAQQKSVKAKSSGSASRFCPHGVYSVKKKKQNSPNYKRS